MEFVNSLFDFAGGYIGAGTGAISHAYGLPLNQLLTKEFIFSPPGFTLLITLAVLYLSYTLLFPGLTLQEDIVFDEELLDGFETVGVKKNLQLEDIPTLVEEMRLSFESGYTLPYSKRMEQLKAMKRMFVENEDAICAALKEDLNRPNFEGVVYDVLVPLGEINHTISHLKKWMQPKSKGFSLLTFPSQQWLQKEPMGVVCVIGSWNYPFMLSLVPVMGAIAAGNTVVLKPCNVSSACARLQVELVEKYMDPLVVSCVGPAIKGDRHTTAALLEHRFDTIFFTGSPDVGKVIATGAAKFLTPCILELGGKNPVFVDSSADISLAAKRTLWARNMNAGQQCISPDFAMVHEDKVDEFCEACKGWIDTFFDGQPAKESKDFGRIVGDGQVKRIQGMLKSHKGKVVCGGEVDAAERYIAPTVIKVKVGSPGLEDETFGPILWVVAVKDMDAAITYMQGRAKPLSQYIFAGDKKVVNRILQNTSAGGVTVNGCLFHCGHPDLPFGGIGNSGMGGYHGESSFNAFTHLKPVLDKAVWADGGLLSDPFVLYAPWTDFKLKVMRNMF